MSIFTVAKRDPAAKAKHLRRAGVVPCVIYGGSLPESVSVQMDQPSAAKLFKENREGSKIQLRLDGHAIPVQVKDKTRDSLNNEILHIGFQALKSDQRVNSITHIIVQNADKVSGILERIMFEIPYSSLPDDMIDTVTVDLDGMPAGTVLTIGEIPEFRRGSVELQVDADSIVLRISDKRRSLRPTSGDEAEA